MKVLRYIPLEKVACFGVAAVLCLTVSASFAEEKPKFLDEAEIKKAYEAAAKRYRGTAESPKLAPVETSKPKVEEVPVSEVELVEEEEKPAAEAEDMAAFDVVEESTTEEEVVEEGAQAPAPVEEGMVRLGAPQRQGEKPAANTELPDIRLQVDVEGKTIREVVDEIVLAARHDAGEWFVKWRLKKENEYLLREKVNLTAETTFGGFVEHLVERVRNMTGVQLFVTVFDGTKIIIISDTYY